MTIDSILIDWYRLQRVIMCDNPTQARNAEFQKDTYESVAFLRYGFDFKNPSELYLCKRDINSRRCFIHKLKSGEDLTKQKDEEQSNEWQELIRRSKREKKEKTPVDEMPAPKKVIRSPRKSPAKEAVKQRTEEEPKSKKKASPEKAQP